ncbi:MAG: DNA-directed RNA polymerase subunit beta [Candidatus Nomurabacteria bacterium]|jgi:DNA-directed RNA polymerase subunit beta|nr:DNA-directed RNA polymerase subunit beta [Candidatus Nomurabacteria bacterium]
MANNSKKTPGITERKYFTPLNVALEMPNLIEHQKKSWREFVETGLREVLDEFNPVDDYTYDPEDAKSGKLSLIIKDARFGEPKTTAAEARDRNLTYEVPLYATAVLTNKVTGEVKETKDYYLGDYPWMTDQATFIINGIERVIVNQLLRAPGVVFTENKKTGLIDARLIPTRGAWLEFEIKNDVIFVSIDKRRKVPVTTFLRALGLGSNSAISEVFKDTDGADKYIKATVEKDRAKTVNEGLMELYRTLRPGDQFTIDNAKGMITRMFFDPRRFDIGKVGRYKLNQRLNLDVKDAPEARILLLDDLYAILRELIRVNDSNDIADDIDALQNRRVRQVGELVAQQFRVGLARTGRNIRDRMAQADLTSVSPASLINTRPVIAAVRDFFLTSQLSQLMEQVNPLSELAQKRHLTSAGPGGIARDRAGYETRDVHPTHYSRICPIETPEGPAIGLVLNLASHARINEYGFIEAPYLKVENGRVTDKIVYLDASQEAAEVIADSSNEVKDGKIVSKMVSARDHLDPKLVERDAVSYIDATNIQTIGSTAGLIPFVERSAVGRNLMGANMQRQAVPLIRTSAPTVGTGIEHTIALNSGQLVLAEDNGEVIKADADEIQIKYAPKDIRSYKLTHFVRSNDAGSYNQKVVVERGDKVVKGQPIIEGASIADGEIALGNDITVAFMLWDGYNMEDSIIISERLVQNDDLTSVHIDVETVEVRETKLGDEIITRDIPNVSEELLQHLDGDGIVTIGSEVKSGDILVGKITPKGEQELSSEERLLRAIFGEKAKDVRDTSKRVGHSQGGRVIDVKVFDREHGDELHTGVLQIIEIYIAQVRKVEVGDKLAGRYGNKGVVAKIVPIEDMPFMEDGTPIDMILSPLGVPSRSNLAQLFEVHIGAAAKKLGYKVATPSFEGVKNDVIAAELKKAGMPENGKVQLYDGRTGDPFQEHSTVGTMYMLKLHHMVLDKLHARSVGPYAMVTQQPLGGKAQNGGQRLGEMEVWALEAYGAASVLQEMLTIKSDDVIGRSRAYQSIIKGMPIEPSAIPETFNVLRKQLQGLGLRIDLVEDGQEIDAEDAIASVREEENTVPLDEIVDKNGDEEVKDESDDLGDLEGIGIELAEEFGDETDETDNTEEEDM